jgi:hypothetical protein
MKADFQIRTTDFDWVNLKRNWKNTSWWIKLYRETILSPYLPNKGIYVYDESWDNLIILDSCRYDTFKEVNTIQGRLESRISRGSATPEFLLQNFAVHPTRASFQDVVYVTANPFVGWLLPDKFYKIYHVWDYGWDDNLRTVHPEKVVNSALEARNRYHNKRLIIHFMQPHFPPLVGGPKEDTGQSGIRKSVLTNVDPFDFLRFKGIGPELLDTNCDHLLATGKLRKDEVYSAYKENLKIVLAYVNDLIQILPGTTVVTSDHGNMFGERLGAVYPFKSYGHRVGLRLGALVLVPWLITTNLKAEIYQTAETGETAHSYSADDEKVKDRLRKLGYL